MLIISCEHASNKIPANLQNRLKIPRAILKTHRGHDIGAPEIARKIAKSLKAPYFAGRMSRLVVDLNRSLTSAGLFSPWSKKLSEFEREKILAEHYLPYRLHLTEVIEKSVKKASPVLHFSVHSFTPKLNGETRTAEIGLLYDPSRANESKLAGHLENGLNNSIPKLRVRRNYPYKGTSDGITTYMRRHFSNESYLGLEIEINQNLFLDTKSAKIKILTETLRESLKSFIF